MNRHKDGDRGPRTVGQGRSKRTEETGNPTPYRTPGAAEAGVEVRLRNPEADTGIAGRGKPRPAAFRRSLLPNADPVGRAHE
jgi:hypothetical protein